MRFHLFFACAWALGVLSCAPVNHEVPPVHRKMFALIENFDRLDTDGDGYINRHELGKGGEWLGPDRLTKEQCDRAMLVYDTDQDKRISKKEARTAAEHGPVLFEN